jgi:hypothetical protein
MTDDMQDMRDSIFSQLDLLRGHPNEGGYLADVVGVVNVSLNNMYIRKALVDLQNEVARLSGTDMPEPPRPTAPVTYLQMVKDPD